MKVLNYVKSLLPDIEKRTVIENLQVLKEELSGVTIPLYEQASKVFISNRFNSPLVKAFDSDMKKEVPSFRTNHIITILRALKNSADIVEALIGVMGKSQNDTFFKDGMTVLKANQLQYSDVSSFVTSYARRWLLHLYSLESIYDYTADDYLKSNEFLRERGYFEKYKQNFFTGIRILSRSPQDVEKAFDAIPDMVVDPDSNIDPSILSGASKVDPLQFGLLPTKINPIYGIRMAYTNWQLKKHTLMVEEKQQLELKLLLLKQSKENNSDPKLEKQIEYNENKIEKLRYEIARMEGSIDG